MRGMREFIKGMFTRQKLVRKGKDFEWEKVEIDPLDSRQMLREILKDIRFVIFSASYEGYKGFKLGVAVKMMKFLVKKYNRLLNEHDTKKLQNTIKMPVKDDEVIRGVIEKLQAIRIAEGLHFYKPQKDNLYSCVFYNKHRKIILSEDPEIAWLERLQAQKEIEIEIGASEKTRSQIVVHQYATYNLENKKRDMLILYAWDEEHNQKHPEHIRIYKAISTSKTMRRFYGYEPEPPLIL